MLSFSPVRTCDTAVCHAVLRASSVALGPGTADPYGHKAVRASMGALFSVPVARVREDLDKFALESHKRAVKATDDQAFRMR